MKYEIKELDLSGILDTGFKLFQNHFVLLFKIACYIMLPLQIAQQLALWIIMPELVSNPEALAQIISENPGRLILFYAIALFFALLIGVVAMPITNGAAIYAISNEYLGYKTTSMQAIRVAARRFLGLVGTNLLAGLIILGGAILCIAPGIYLALKYYLSSYVVILEHRVGMDALNRSGMLMNKNIGKALALGAILFVISFAMGFIQGLIGQAVIGSVIAIVTNTLMMLLGVVFGVTLYFSARCMHDKFDLKLLADAVGRPTPREQADTRKI